MRAAENPEGLSGVVSVTLGASVELSSHSLTNGVLDWAMAQAEGVAVYFSSNGSCWLDDKPNQRYSPSSRFRQSGQLLDKYDVQIITGTTGGRVAYLRDPELYACGPDTLVAMCRLIVVFKLGEKVRVPAKLAEIFQRESEEANQ